MGISKVIYKYTDNTNSSFERFKQMFYDDN